MYIGLHVNFQFFFHVLMKREFLRHVQGNTHISDFMKIRPLGANPVHANRRTERRYKTNSSKVFFLFSPTDALYICLEVH